MPSALAPLKRLLAIAFAVVVGPFLVALWVHWIARWIDWLSPYEHTRLMLFGRGINRYLEALTQYAWPLAAVAIALLFRRAVGGAYSRAFGYSRRARTGLASSSRVKHGDLLDRRKRRRTRRTEDAHGLPKSRRDHPAIVDRDRPG